MPGTLPAIPPPARIKPAGAAARPRPAVPERPVAVPTPTPPAPTQDPSTDAVPPQGFEQIPDSLPELIEDEETIAAAPDASAFARRPAAQKPAHEPIYANLFLRRTLIPILLTCGVLLLAIGIWSMIDRDAPLAAIGTGAELLLIVIGVILLAVGLLNAFHVKHILQTQAGKG